MQILIVLVICGVVTGQYRSNTNRYYKADGFFYPGSSSASSSNSQYNNQHEPTKLAKSIALAKKIDKLETVDQFLNMIDGVPEDEVDSTIMNRSGQRSSRAVRPIPARCLPEPKTVSFVVDEYDPSLSYYPSCTRVNRCGGCCSHPLTSCQPEATELVNYEVTVTKFGIGDVIVWHEKQIMPLEVHLNCSCACIVKEKDCKPSQVYLKDECRCECKSIEEEIKCKQSNYVKIWDPSNCTCSCRNVEMCSTGDYFDKNSCRCGFDGLIFN
ncbi:vascular endothelial growth factor A isoform X2 [Aphidius gifuensis]|uniref:vascular endothelial growth factor A isoform X2 n=1 Tax=Aphidius gifuensis TaxID=684658 RepID=UPI001CDB9366|nr:vascular endothelial growth factor A isoform X2 [Aphidius gifuensis]